MHFLGLGVRRNWNEQDQAIRAQFDHHWRSLWWIGVISGLVVLASLLISDRYWPWASPWIIAGFAALLLGVVLWRTIGQDIDGRSQSNQVRHPGWGRNELLAAGALLVISFVMAGLSAPTGSNQLAFSDGRVLGVLLVPACTFGLLAWTKRITIASGRETAWNRLGLYSPRWKLDALIGAMAGLSLGLHAWLVTYLFDNFQVQVDVVHLIWVVFLRVGMLAPAHELFVRGLAFDFLREGKKPSFVRTAIPLAILDLVIGLPIIFSVPHWTDHFHLGVYWLAYGFLAVYLRYRRESLLVTWSSNLFFALILEVLLR